jgi:zinc D-Ala-D-Ala carboxypeptidase
MTRLSEHFTLQEFLVSSKADQLGIDNSPTPEHLENLKKTAANFEKVRSILGDCAIVITSGYRNPRLNAAVDGVENSAHALGHAGDFRAAGFSALGAAQRIRDAQAAGRIQFDQLILETSRGVVHLSFDPDRRRNQVLTQAGGPKSPTRPGLHA